MGEVIVDLFLRDPHETRELERGAWALAEVAKEPTSQHMHRGAGHRPALALDG
jgi:hypothetical protein